MVNYVHIAKSGGLSNAFWPLWSTPNTIWIHINSHLWKLKFMAKSGDCRILIPRHGGILKPFEKQLLAWYWTLIGIDPITGGNKSLETWSTHNFLDNGNIQCILCFYECAWFVFVFCNFGVFVFIFPLDFMYK